MLTALPTPAADVTAADVFALQRMVFTRAQAHAVRAVVDKWGPGAQIVSVEPLKLPTWQTPLTAVLPTTTGAPCLLFGIHADPAAVCRWLRWVGSESARTVPWEVYEAADLALDGRLPRGVTTSDYVERWAQLSRRDLQYSNPASRLFDTRAGTRRAVELLREDVRVYLLMREPAAAFA